VIVAVADTHTILWYLFGDSRLSDVAKKYIDQASIRQENIGVSSITLAEVLYLAEKNASLQIRSQDSFKRCTFLEGSS